MPKIYSTEERNNIIHRLKEESRFCLQNYGVKGTTVDMLVKRVGIPKGTFYLFYKTKELLLFEVLLEQHEIIENNLYTALQALHNKVNVENLTTVIFDFYKVIDESGILKLLTTGEIELLQRKLPPALVQEHLVHDADMINKIVDILSLPKKENIEYYSTAFLTLFLSVVYKREMGQEYFDEGLRLTIRGLVIQLIE
ncbi:MAG: TetR/AcrR family transcriptional regulator [Coprobacillaceae bacterium]